MLKQLLSLYVLLIFLLAFLLLLAAVLPRARVRFLIWRRRPFKRAIMEAYSDGLLTSFQMHDLLGRFDEIGGRPKNGRVTRRVEYAEIPRDLSEKDQAVLGALPRDLPPFTEKDEVDRLKVTASYYENGCGGVHFCGEPPAQIKSEQ